MRWRPPATELALLRSNLPSASHSPSAPSWPGLPPPTGSVLRFSQPLDGLGCPGASRPCFVPLPLLGFALQSLPLPGSRAPLEACCSPAVESLPASPGRSLASHLERPPPVVAKTCPAQDGAPLYARCRLQSLASLAIDRPSTPRLSTPEGASRQKASRRPREPSGQRARIPGPEHSSAPKLYSS